MNVARQNFSAIWPTHVEGLIEFLTRLRVAFNGDLDAALIMSVIGAGAMSRQSSRKVWSYNNQLEEEGRFERFESINTLSISTITGIPRETVRRKTLAMQKRGWLARDVNGCWSVTKMGAQDLEPMTEYSLDYLGRLFSAFLRVPSGDALR
jgi:hypothetical protein